MQMLCNALLNFNSRTPRGVRQRCRLVKWCKIRISTHAPHAECDTDAWAVYENTNNISTHAPHAECDVIGINPSTKRKNISTHAPHAECDLSRIVSITFMLYFNSRTPRGVRPASPIPPLWCSKFQLTHPTRSATALSAGYLKNMQFQLTHPTRSATDELWDGLELWVFQLTHPTRSATSRAEPPAWAHYNFNSRTPRGVRHRNGEENAGLVNFNSRTPRGVRLNVFHNSLINYHISTHAPHAECDKTKYIGTCITDDFNSRTPRGVRHNNG